MMHTCSEILFNVLSCIIMKEYRSFLSTFLIILFIVHNTHSNKCEESVTSFSLLSKRNSTGHWLSEMTMDFGHHDSNGEENKLTRPWKVAIDFGREICAGKETLHVVAAITVPPGKPDSGYQLYSGIGYYKFHTDMKNWEDARKTCAAEGGHLVILNSETEAQLIKQMFAQYPKLGKWIHAGFHDRAIEGQYLTLFGEPLNTTGYTKWLSGQPDNYGGSATTEGEDCGSLSRDGTLNDVNCNGKAVFICEHGL